MGEGKCEGGIFGFFCVHEILLVSPISIKTVRRLRDVPPTHTTRQVSFFQSIPTSQVGDKIESFLQMVRILLERHDSIRKRLIELLAKLSRCEGGAIKYGDVIQLQHRASGLYVSLHKTPAHVNPNNRRVSLKR